MVGGRTVNVWKKWSNEWQQPKKGDLGYWTDFLMYYMETYWKGKVKSAAIFDTRFQKICIGSERDTGCNKLYQYQDGAWRAVAR